MRAIVNEADGKVLPLRVEVHRASTHKSPVAPSVPTRMGFQPTTHNTQLEVTRSDNLFL